MKFNVVGVLGLEVILKRESLWVESEAVNDFRSIVGDAGLNLSQLPSMDGRVM